MPFAANSFVDGPAGGTPITAATLNNLELGVVADDITTPGSAAAVSLASQLTQLNIRFSQVITPEFYGAVGNGVADDTTAWINAAAALKAAARQGIDANHLQPGATLFAKGIYNLASLAAPIALVGNVSASAASLLIPSAYAGAAVLIGHDVSGKLLQSASIAMPDVSRPYTATPTVGSVGVRIQNLYSSNVQFGRTMNFEVAHNYTGLNQGTSYNQIGIGWITGSKYAITLIPMAGGWVNQNTFEGGSIQQDSSMGANRSVGYRHVILDGTGTNVVNGNTFLGVSFEGDVSEYVFEFKNAFDNVFVGCRHETGTAATATTVSGSTFTSTAHGLTVGNTIVLLATTTMPGGIFVATAYFVTATTANTFSVSRQRGGTAITTSSAGSGVVWRRPPAIKYWSDTACYNNVIKNPMTTNQVLEQIFTSFSGGGNAVEIGELRTADYYADNDAPIFRARNFSTSVNRPAFAAYPPANDPLMNPDGWSAALSDQGVLLKGATVETSRVWADGAMFYRRGADSVNFEIPSVRRSGGYTLSVSALSCVAATTTATTFTLTGCLVGDLVTVTPQAGLPAGLGVAYAHVSSADTITVGFINVTASAISLTKAFNFIAARQYY